MENVEQNNAAVLAKLSSGKDLFEPFECEIKDEKVIFQMRPLSNGEINKISGIQLSSITVNASGDPTKHKPEDIKVGVDIESLTKLQKEAKYTAIAFSLSGEKNKFTADNIKSMFVPVEIIADLFNNVLTLSHISEDVLLPFHKELSRSTIKSSSSDRT